MAKNQKAKEVIEKIEEVETIVDANGNPITVSGEVPQETTETTETSDETTNVDTATSSENAASSEEEKSEPPAETADNDAPAAGTDEPAKSADKEYDPFLFPVSPEGVTFAVAGTGHSHEVIDGHVSCEECHGSLYPDPVVEIESYSFDASTQES